jgi:oligoribonuclease
MPDVLTVLHYRNVDVSTLKVLAAMWWPELPQPDKKGAHRALDDIRESIDLLRYYREKEFICGP